MNYLNLEKLRQKNNQNKAKRKGGAVEYAKQSIELNGPKALEQIHKKSNVRMVKIETF